MSADENLVLRQHARGPKMPHDARVRHGAPLADNMPETLHLRIA